MKRDNMSDKEVKKVAEANFTEKIQVLDDQGEINQKLWNRLGDL